MQFGYSETCLEHDTGERHPESPDRLRAIREGLSRRHGVTYRDPPAARKAAVSTVHESDYVDEFETFCAEGGGNWDPDTVACESTWDAALQSAGLAQWAAEQALSGADGRETPFALGRPPGHHAIEDDAMGFCFFNNAAVAAQSVLDSGQADHVAIFDWDVHHGNGTQDIFFDRGDVSYASIHEEGLYPGTGDASETGTGDGAGSTYNVPLPAGCGDPAYMYALEHGIIPFFDKFEPDLLIVSAGFDAHRHDPISRMRVSSEGFAMMTDRLQMVADTTNTSLAFVLEGGYGLDTLSEGVGMVHETFDGRTPIEPEGPVADSVADLVADVNENVGL